MCTCIVCMTPYSIVTAPLSDKLIATIVVVVVLVSFLVFFILAVGVIYFIKSRNGKR